MEITKEFIKANADKTLREVFPQVFYPEKITGWVKDKYQPKWMLYLENNVIKYGFDLSGKWVDNIKDVYSLQNDDYLATDEEVRTALAAEAKRRGFKEGVWVKNHQSKKAIQMKGVDYVYSDEYNIGIWERTTSHGLWVFMNGVWSDIIPSITKEEAEKQLRVKIE